MPGNNFTRKQIHYNAKVVPFAINLNICKITGSDNVRSFLVECLIEMVGVFYLFGGKNFAIVNFNG